MVLKVVLCVFLANIFTCKMYCSDVLKVSYNFFNILNW